MNSERNIEYLKMFIEERMRLLRIEFYNKNSDKNLWIEWFYKYTDKAKKLNADNYEILARYIKMLAYKCLGEYFYYKNT